MRAAKLLLVLLFPALFSLSGSGSLEPVAGERTLLCRDWKGGQVVGQLDPVALPEASGMSRSSLFPDRLYIVNDAGNSNSFYYGNLQAQELERVRMIDYFLSKEDIEDLDIGPCPAGSCLFIGAIGNNARIADTPEVVIIPEAETFSHPERPDEQAAAPWKVLKLAYPDGAYDAEGLAVHPNGDLYIITKARPSLLGVAPARLYRLAGAAQQTEDDVHTLSFVGSLDLRSLSGSSLDIFSHIVTGLDIAGDGGQFLLLTYGNAFAFDIDLAQVTGDLAPHIGPESYQQISLRRLPQQESVSYLDERRFIYTTEIRGGVADLVEMRCQNREAQAAIR